MNKKRKSKNGKAKAILFTALFCTVTVTLTVAVKGNQPKATGYIQDSGSTIWEMATRHCPDDMDVRSFVREIEKVNGIRDAVVYENCLYKIPVYEED